MCIFTSKTACYLLCFVERILFGEEFTSPTTLTVVVVVVYSISRVQPFCNPMDCSTPGFSAQAPLGFPRQEWSWLPFPSSGVLLDQGTEPIFLALAGGFVTTGPPEKPKIIITALILQIRKVRWGGERARGRQSSISFLNSSSPTAFIWPCWSCWQHLNVPVTGLNKICIWRKPVEKLLCKLWSATKDIRPYYAGLQNTMDSRILSPYIIRCFQKDAWHYK